MTPPPAWLWALQLIVSCMLYYKKLDVVLQDSRPVSCITRSCTAGSCITVSQMLYSSIPGSRMLYSRKSYAVCCTVGSRTVVRQEAGCCIPVIQEVVLQECRMSYVVFQDVGCSTAGSSIAGSTAASVRRTARSAVQRGGRGPLPSGQCSVWRAVKPVEGAAIWIPVLGPCSLQ